MEILRDDDGAEFGISRERAARQLQARVRDAQRKRRQAYRQLRAAKPLTIERVEPRFKLFATKDGRLAYRVVKPLTLASHSGVVSGKETEITLPWLSIQG